MTKARVLIDLQTKQEYIIHSYDYTTIGRGEPNNIQTNPEDRTVSRKHATIYNDDGVVYVQDNKSENGTYIHKEGAPEDEYEFVTRNSLLPLNHLLSLGRYYKFRLEQRDLKAEASKEKTARLEKTIAGEI